MDTCLLFIVSFLFLIVFEHMILNQDFKNFTWKGKNQKAVRKQNQISTGICFTTWTRAVSTMNLLL